MPVIIPTVQQELDWKALREGIKSCIKEVVGDAVVYSSWPLRYSVGDTVRLLTSKAEGKVHAWIIGINRAQVYADKVGGHQLEWELNVRIWGFFGYDSTYTADVQNAAEEEIKAVTRVIYANAKTFNMESTQALATDGIIDWDDIDVQAFGSGDDVLVAQGSLTIKARENYAGY